MVYFSDGSHNKILSEKLLKNQNQLVIFVKNKLQKEM
jgi:hypothetical protein